MTMFWKQNRLVAAKGEGQVTGKRKMGVIWQDSARVPCSDAVFSIVLGS